MMRAFMSPTLLVWAGVSLAVGIAIIMIALIGGPGVTAPRIQQAADPGIKVWDASDGKREPGR
jgi:hypothetical protein